MPHALAVSSSGQGKGIGRYFMGEILKLAKAEKKKAVRLDILGTNTAAERLYKGCGFHFVQAKDMFYEDTGWTEYKMYERAVLFLSGRDRKTGKIISWKRRKRI